MKKFLLLCVAAATLMATACTPQEVPEAKVTNITVTSTPSPLTLTIGGATGKVTANILPANATNKGVTWSAAPLGIVAVDASGNVTPLAAGTATIAATAVDGSWVTGSCAVSVSSSIETLVYPGAPLRDLFFFDRTISQSLFPNNLSNNSVTVLSGTIGGMIAGGFTLSNQTVENNTVTIQGGGTVPYSDGGIAVLGGGSYGDAINNKVIIRNFTMHLWAGILGGIGGQRANGNSVTMNGGEVSVVAGGGGLEVSANSNSVTINGGKVTRGIAGGESDYGTVMHNVVTITGTPDLTNAELYGGISYSDADDFTGNTLNIQTTNLKVETIYHFSNLNFIFNAPLALSMPALIVGNEACLHDDFFDWGKGTGKKTTVTISFSGVPPILHTNDEIVLIYANGFDAKITGVPANATTTGGGYTFALSVSSNRLIAKVL